MELHKKHVANVDCNIYKMLDFEGMPCNKDETYRSDKCIHNHLEKESKRKFGCVTPFGLKKDNICKNDDKAKNAYNMYKNYRLNGLKMTNYSCLEPCTYMGIKIIKGSEVEYDDGAMLVLYFNEYIQEISNYYSYDSLSFIAEIGGYVGLFLGYSIFQITDLFSFMTRKLRGTKWVSSIAIDCGFS